MTKNKITPGNYLFPLPAVIVGANVGGKANFMTIAWCSIAEQKPPMILISAAQAHYTNNGIKENQTFSINIASEDMVEAVDYIGLKSGKSIDKSKIFEIFYGDLENAPMVKEAPINLECKVVNSVDTGKGHEIFIGEIINAYAEEEYLTNGVPDISKVKPLIYATGTKEYWNVGKAIDKAWKIGQKYKKET